MFNSGLFTYYIFRLVNYYHARDRGCCYARAQFHRLCHPQWEAQLACHLRCSRRWQHHLQALSIGPGMVGGSLEPVEAELSLLRHERA